MAEVTQDVLLRIGATVAPGAKNAVAGLSNDFMAMAQKVTLVTAGIAAATMAINKFLEQGKQFDDLINRSTSDMTLLNRSTAGLIDTFAAYRGANRVAATGTEATAKQLEAMGKAAIYMNRQLGGKAGGATEVFERLADAISKGTPEALVPFGVELKGITSKSEMTAESLKQLESQFGSLVIEAEDATERMYALRNAMGTVSAAFADMLVDKTAETFDDILSSVFGLSDGLLELESQILSTDGAFLGWNFSLEAIGESIFELLGLLERATGFQSGAGKALENVRKNTGAKDLYDITRNVKYEREYSWWADAQARRKKRQAGDRSRRAMDAPDEAESMSTSTRSGGRRRDVVDMEFSEAEIEAADLAARSFKLPQFFSYNGPQVSGQFQAPGRGGGAAASEAQTGVSSAAELAAIMAEADKAYAEMRVQNETSLIETLMGMESEYYAQKKTWREMDTQEQSRALDFLGSITASTFRNISDAVGTESRKSFKASQAFAFAASQVEGMMASIAVFRSALQSTIPFPANVIVGAAAATAVTAQAIATGVRILKQQYGGSTPAASPTMKGGSFDVGGFGSQPAQAPANYSFTINVGGSSVWQQMVRENEMQQRNGNKAFVVQQ